MQDSPLSRNQEQIAEKDPELSVSFKKSILPVGDTIDTAGVGVYKVRGNR